MPRVGWLVLVALAGSLIFLTFALSEAGFISTGLESVWGVSNNPARALESARSNLGNAYVAQGDFKVNFTEVGSQANFNTSETFEYKFIDTKDSGLANFEYSLTGENSGQIDLVQKPNSMDWQGFLQNLSQNISGSRSKGKTLNGAASKTFTAVSSNPVLLSAILPQLIAEQANLEIEFSISNNTKQVNQILIKGNFSGTNLKGSLEGQVGF